MSTNKEKKLDNWITQAEAARIRGVSRQAINKLVKKGRIKTLVISSTVFVDKNDIKNFIASNSGRPRKNKDG